MYRLVSIGDKYDNAVLASFNTLQDVIQYLARYNLRVSDIPKEQRIFVGTCTNGVWANMILNIALSKNLEGCQNITEWLGDSLMGGKVGYPANQAIKVKTKFHDLSDSDYFGIRHYYYIHHRAIIDESNNSVDMTRYIKDVLALEDKYIIKPRNSDTVYRVDPVPNTGIKSRFKLYLRNSRIGHNIRELNNPEYDEYTRSKRRAKLDYNMTWGDGQRNLRSKSWKDCTKRKHQYKSL